MSTLATSAIARGELRRDPTPTRDLLEGFDPLNLIRPIDELLETTVTPRHRKMLANYRKHALLEILGRWGEFLNTDMMIEQPFYRAGALAPIDGSEGIRQFYEKLIGDGLVGGLLTHKIAVADWGIAIEAFMYMQIRGADLIEQGEEVNADSWYAVTVWSSCFWPFDDECRLIGEMIYEDPASRRVTELAPALVMTPVRMRELIKPLLEEETVEHA